MCLLVVGWRVHPDYPLVVAANRDEFYARPSATLARWPESPEIIGGRDLEAGGTWLGITESGRFAGVTNVREPGMAKGERSRGALTRDFLSTGVSVAEHAAQIDGAQYSGFNLLPCPAYPTNRRFSRCWPIRPSSPTRPCPPPASPSNGKGCSRPSSSNPKTTAHGRQHWPGKAPTAPSPCTNKASARMVGRFSPR